MIELTGYIIWNTGMWRHRIYQRGLKFYFETQSEMMEEPSTSIYSSLEEAFNEMLSNT